MQSSSSRNHSVNHVDAEDQNFPWMQRGARLGALEVRSSYSETGQKDQPHNCQDQEGAILSLRKSKSVVSNTGFNTFLSSE